MDRHRRVRTLGVALVVLVVLAGCNGAVDRQPERPVTVTPAAVPDAPRTATGAWVAPGVTETDVVDVGALVDAHTRTLANTSYTVTQTVVERSESGTVRADYRSVVMVDGDRFAYRLRQTDRDDREAAVSRLERWSDGERVLVARTVDNETSYTARAVTPDAPTSVPGSASNGRSLQRVLGLVEVQVTPAPDWTDRYRLRTPRPQTIRPLENITVVATLTPQGVVTDYRVEYVVDRGDEDIAVSVRVSFTAIGETTVERPSWYGAAVEATEADAERQRALTSGTRPAV